MPTAVAIKMTVICLLWDFRDKDQVQIHVRTWQPRWMNDNHTEEIAQEDIFTPGDFVIDL